MHHAAFLAANQRYDGGTVPQTIIHLSDLHIGLRKAEYERCARLFAYVTNKYPGSPVLITGDLVDSATEKQFRQMRGLLDQLAQSNPILAVPGNHDYAWKGNILRPDGWANWVKYLGSPLGWGEAEVPWMDEEHEVKGVDGLGVWKMGQIVFFGVDSGDPLDKQVSARGFISTKLASGLHTALDAYEGKTRVVFLHHHPFNEGFFMKLEGSPRLLKAIKERCELLLFGHNHEYGLWYNERGVDFTVASHKSTDHISGELLFVTVIEVKKPGTPDVSFSHRLEVVT